MALMGGSGRRKILSNKNGYKVEVKTGFGARMSKKKSCQPKNWKLHFFVPVFILSSQNPDSVKKSQ